MRLDVTMLTDKPTLRMLENAMYSHGRTRRYIIFFEVNAE